MYLSHFVLASVLVASTIGSIIDGGLLSRASDNNPGEAYLQRVCYPNTTHPVPPCQEIINIQTACEPNGTTTLYLQTHAQCMCGGSFFSDWIGCLDCNYIHGARSEKNVDAFHSIITTASHILCTGTPTASFAAIFSSVNGGIQGTGATVMSDQFPSNTAVSLYYTPTGVQGIGAITGSATGATATAKPTTSNGSTSKPGAANQSSSNTSTSGAAPTGFIMGMIGMVAGGVMMGAL